MIIQAPAAGNAAEAPAGETGSKAVGEALNAAAANLLARAAAATGSEEQRTDAPCVFVRAYFETLEPDEEQARRLSMVM
jgi:hypothetical protein